jgi:ubiquinol-cytochrome c reductase cytochrome b subunit
MAVSVLIFSVLPFADRTSIPGGARYRPIYRVMFYVFVVDVLVLGYVGAKPPLGFVVTLGQVATFVYFATFFLLPFVSRAEERWMRARGLPDDLKALFQKRPPRKKWPSKWKAK